jgi:glycosyltransferase involved in cell wall biosynthesis
MDIVSEYAKSSKFPIEIHENLQNVGHGASTIRGLSVALESASKFDFILTLDSDGQVSGKELGKLIETQQLLNPEVVIGIRTQRTDLLYRRIITRLAITSLFLITGVKSRDSNTPVRLWKSETLSDSLSRIAEPNLCVPNIHLTRVIVEREYKIAHCEIVQRDRNGEKTMGVTWSNKWSHLPSRKLLIFSQKALKELWVHR